MGDKALARRLMKEAGLPLLPRERGTAADARAIQAVARRIDYPLILKAAAGGGGRGMRVVRSDRELETALPVAQAEAEAAFGNGDIYVEKYLEDPRHIEVQIIADGRGHVVAIGERECSLQRRHQKVLEEAPAPGLRDSVRQTLFKAAIRGAKADRLRQCRHLRVPAGEGWPRLFHGDETRASRSSTRSPRRQPGSTWSSGNCASPPGSR